MNDAFCDMLAELFNQNDIVYQKSSLDKFKAYAEFLVEYNKQVNLTAITEPEEIAVKHFLDSAIVLKHFDIREGARLIDIGTGAGFPGVPIKLLRDDIALSLLDSLNKRIIFLDKLSKKIDIPFEAIHGRAEECRKNKLFAKYDVVTSRAVAPLNVLSELCIPYLKDGGVFLALKANIEKELKESRNAIKTLGAELVEVKEYRLDEDIKRCLVIIKKTKPLDSKYPRSFAKIKKNPL